jgi:hypothetical protein
MKVLNLPHPILCRVGSIIAISMTRAFLDTGPLFCPSFRRPSASFSSRFVHFASFSILYAAFRLFHCAAKMKVASCNHTAVCQALTVSYNTTVRVGISYRSLLGGSGTPATWYLTKYHYSSSAKIWNLEDTMACLDTKTCVGTCASIPMQDQCSIPTNLPTFQSTTSGAPYQWGTTPTTLPQSLPTAPMVGSNFETSPRFSLGRKCHL